MSDSQSDVNPRGEEYTTFCANSGAFFHCYTALEHELTLHVFTVVTRFTNDNRLPVMLAVLGGQRMSPVKDTIKRLLRATNANKKRTQWVDGIFQHLGEIQFFRDRLAHHFTRMTDETDVWENMNFAGVRERSKLEDIRFHVSILAAATGDLWQMRVLAESLFSHHIRKAGQSRATPPPPTWLYKPSMLVRDRRIPIENRKRRKRPPRSSRAKSKPQ
jgi:hypothetical protein